MKAGDVLYKQGRSRLYRENPDFTNERLHPCGCVTFFNVIRWRSTIVFACDEHKEHERVT